MDIETIEGVKMLGDDGKPFLVIRVHPDDLANATEAVRAAQFYRGEMGDRIVLAAKVGPTSWKTYGDKEFDAQFSGYQLVMAEWETFEMTPGWSLPR